MAEQATDDDFFSAVSMKAICARLNIPVTTYINAEGKADLLIDRAGMERLRDSMLLVGEIDLAQFMDDCIAKHLPPTEEVA